MSQQQPVEIQPVIRVRDLYVGFGTKMVLKGLNLDVKAGEVMGFVGGSGQGKSVLDIGAGQASAEAPDGAPGALGEARDG